jgi:hypothetical protein
VGLKLVFNTTHATPDDGLLFKAKTHFEFIDGLLAMDIELIAAPSLQVPVCAGVTFWLHAGLTEAAWFGSGPFASAPNRLNGAPAGVHGARIADGLLLPCPDAGELRQQVRWLTLTDPAGAGLRIRARAPLFGFALSRGTGRDPFREARVPAADALRLDLVFHTAPAPPIGDGPACAAPAPNRFHFGCLLEPLPAAEPQNP